MVDLSSCYSLDQIMMLLALYYLPVISLKSHKIPHHQINLSILYYPFALLYCNSMAAKLSLYYHHQNHQIMFYDKIDYLSQVNLINLSMDLISLISA